MHRSPPQNRRAAAAVELACTLPIIVLLMTGALELGRALMVQHACDEAARAACRVAALQHGSHSDVSQAVRKVMEPAGFGSNYIIGIGPDITQPISTFQPVHVYVYVRYADVALLPGAAKYLGNAQIRGHCVQGYTR